MSFSPGMPCVVAYILTGQSMTGILLLTESDVERALDIESAMCAVRDGFRQAALGLAQSPPWRDVRFGGSTQPHGAGPGITQAMAYLASEHVAILKHFYSFAGSPPVAILRLIDASSGRTLAVMQANHESLMRTGAAGGVAAQYLARESATCAGVLGTGRQAGKQIEFLLHVRPIREVHAFSVESAERREEFASRIEAATGVRVILARCAQDVVQNADILVTATPSTVPIVKATWLSEGLHITSMGADDAYKAELAADVYGKADKVIIDSKKALETGQCQAAFRRGIFNSEDEVTTLGEVIAGIKPGRQSDREITVFHSAGTSVQDAAIALTVYRAACSQGIGVEIHLGNEDSSQEASYKAWIGELAEAWFTAIPSGEQHAKSAQQLSEDGAHE
ncbi:ornithine cyclodeaminase family protein [Candidatus Bipolaricaulota bacterium]